MLTGSRLFLRAGASHALAAKEFNANGRGAPVKPLSVVAAPTQLAAVSTSAVDTPAATAAAARAVSAYTCGFSKDLIGAPSTVGEHGRYGEDACFVSRYKSAYVAGVADGVGGWKKYGIDPSRFSSELMKHCSDLVKAGDFASNRPDELIAKAFERLSVAPRPIGSTACLVVIDEQKCYAANLGDSGFLLYRDGKIIKRSAEQVHYFNAPFQLTILPESCEQEGFITNTAAEADVHVMDVMSGDIVLLATDGLWDNVPDATIVDALKGAQPSNLRAKCNTIALIARRLSTDVHYASPFAVKASEHGIAAHGGKQDDITLVILYIA